MPELPTRTAVRILLVDPDDRLLMHQLVGGWWITIGGGLDPGEDPLDAAVREVREETGLAITPADVGPAVWWGRWQGTKVDQTETFHLVRCPRFEPTLGGLEDYEVVELLQWRWWTLEELARDDEPLMRPIGLGRLLPRVLAGPWQGELVDVSEGRRAL